MRWLFPCILAVAMVVAYIARFVHAPVYVFVSSALALILLSKYLGDATEDLSCHVGQKIAGLFNVTLSNLAEIIIVFVAIRAGEVELVQASIVGSIIGNLLLVLGLSIYLGCKKHGTLEYSHDTAILFINQLLLVGATLMIPTFFNECLSGSCQQTLSYWLAAMLFIAYIYFYRLSLVDPRFHLIAAQGEHMYHDGSWRRATVQLVGCGVGAFLMSELLVGEIEAVGERFQLSKFFMGFVLIPFLGNIAERSVAIMAARKKMVELSLSVSIGSAAQVAMIIAPLAVVFGLLSGHPFSLHLSTPALYSLIASLGLTFVVLHDGKWNINEGAMLLAFYGALVFCFYLAR